MRKLLQRFPTLIAFIFAILFAAAGQAAAVGGPVLLSGDDADDGGHCQGSACGQLYGKSLKFVVTNSQSGGSGILAIGVNGSSALSSLNSWNELANGGPGVPVTHARTSAAIASADFSNFAVIYIPSDDRNTRGGMNTTQLSNLNARQADIVDFVNNQGGGLMALTEAGYSHKYQWLPLSLTTVGTSHSSGIHPTADMNTFAPGITSGNLNHGCCYHTVFTGPAGFSGLKVLAYHDHNNNQQYDGPATDHVLILGGAQITIQGNISLTPPTALNGTGDPHTVTATAEDGNPLAPAAGATVTFAVTAGPNTGASGTCNNPGCTADANGQVSFIYVGLAAGTDSIVASFIDGNGTTQTSNTVEAEWEVRNQPPTADAGPAQIIEQTGPAGSNVTLDGSSSSDPDNDPLTYTWSGGTSATGVNPTVLLGAGTHNITLTVDDGLASDTVSVQIIVQDNIAPVITTTNTTVEATAANTPVDVSGDASATDAVGVVSLTNDSPGSFTVGSHTVTWTACDAANNCSTETQTVIVQDNIAPVITTTDTTVEATAANTPVDVSGDASATDAVGVVSLTNDSPGSFAVGSHTVIWTACDAAGNCSSEPQTVTVEDTIAPVITTTPVTVEATDPSTPVDVTGTATATDAVGVLPLTNDSSGSFAVGSHTVIWTACDAANNCSTETQTVTVTDTTAPDISNACLTDKLWPPNHKMVLVSTGSFSDLGDVNPTISITVASNQPINGTGDGNTDPDWEAVDNGDGTYSVSLRAERAGNIGQRDYTTTVTATDASGNTSEATCSASVPHDQGKNNSPGTKKGKK